MTRKRFVKLAMAHGFSRNEAECLSQGVSVFGSYSKLYEHNKSRMHIKRWTRDVQDTAAKIVNTIIDFTNSWKSILTL